MGFEDLPVVDLCKPEERPWPECLILGEEDFWAKGRDGNPIFRTYGISPQDVENGTHILECVNAHDALVQRVKLLLEYIAWNHEANAGPVQIAMLHSYKCPEEIWRKGIELRAAAGIPGLGEEDPPSDK